VAVRDAQGRWSAPQTLALAPYRTPPYEPPSVAVNGQGAAAVIFTAARSVGYSKGGGASISDPFPVLATRLRPDAPFRVAGPLAGAPKRVRTAPAPFYWLSPRFFSVAPMSTDVALSDQGQLSLLGRSRMGVTVLEGTISGQAGASMSFAGFSNSQPMLAFDGSGNAIAAWTRGTNIVVARRTAGSRRWQTEIVANAGLYGALTALAVSPSGDAVVGWRGRARGVPGPRFPVRDPTARRDRLVQAAVYSAASGRWSRSPVLSRVGEPVGSPQIEIDARGHAVALWVEGANNGRAPSRIVAAEFTPERGWGAQEQISSPATGPVSPDLALSPNGEAIAAWVGCQGSRATVRTAAHPSGGPWTEPNDVPGP
jgi:hypothetical protein